jgi:hypothetical protein
MPPMTRARLKTEVQDVWQFAQYGEVRPTWVRACTEWNDLDLYLVRGTDKQRIERGDWLIRDLDSMPPAWSTDADFQQDYEVVP